MIRTEDLCYAYNQKNGIHHLNLHVPNGSCFGLLGQNGAGKSTTMKLILGLMRADKGSVWIAGKEMQAGALSIYQKIGMLLEEPPLYPYLNAVENLEISCTYRAIDKNRIQEVLTMTGLEDAAEQKTAHYSTGMKQRLGIALALLPDPDLLVLDEPVNGLDPEGIVTIRRLMQQLHRQGKTILMSSHLLHEIELSCDHVGILQNGRLLYAGSLDILKQKQLAVRGLWVHCPQTEQAASLLRQAGYSVHIHQQRLLVSVGEVAESNQLIDILREAKLDIHQLIRQELSLEDLYLHYTQQEEPNRAYS